MYAKIQKVCIYLPPFVTYLEVENDLYFFSHKTFPSNTILATHQPFKKK